ncbi:hypothetical protein MBM_08478 [Drepanopeziza brunnea f. sp. 'multigermtubi' MB_m1]|uniref:Uncharacterized protein n=1 Tax=Marssonina brunnea f. sp. multigermtubi (strain MB_m1) TaxID=1072389 RepID=K1W892_MARBU|nr:uncharacterized protein MBM_08478 [Drepanopeziza brunnea f. sp. 'multigermtubi' MB_m1]EKD13395.1 hypothetical protein MBM_08478 [Drepanopeziza brunnea f. sp. 'multigermtubi' MB_m1]
MRVKKPYLKDRLPNRLCHLCNRAFCVEHKGEKEGVCEINHETYYRNHRGIQHSIYRTYEEWKRDCEKMRLEEMSSGDEGRGGGRAEKEVGGKVVGEDSADVASSQVGGGGGGGVALKSSA